MNWQDSYYATIKWVNAEDVKTNMVPSRQRENIATGNCYCPIARFPNDNYKDTTCAWSVRIHIIASFKVKEHYYSKILVKYLVEEGAPHENFKIYDNFDIYEDPTCVGHVRLHNNKRRHDYVEKTYVK